MDTNTTNTPTNSDETTINPTTPDNAAATPVVETPGEGSENQSSPEVEEQTTAAPQQ